MSNKEITRIYNKEPDEDCFNIEVTDKDITIDIRTEYYYHTDDNCYWAKEINSKIYHSNDDVFTTNKEDATHIVVYLK